MADLATDLRDVVEGALPELDIQRVMGRAQRRRRRRVVAVVAAVATVALGVGTAVITIASNSGDDTKPLRVQAHAPRNPASTATEPVDGLVPTPAPDGPSGALAAVLRLPACEDAGGFVDWAREALRPYDGSAIPLSATLAAAPLVTVAELTAVVAEPGVDGCVAAGNAGYATGWELRDSRGAVLARAISISTTGSAVPQRILDHSGSYHQESIASGQYFNGFVEGDDVEAIIGGGTGRLTVLQINGLSASTYQDGVALEQRLYLAQFQRDSATADLLTPSRMLPGLQLCAVPATYCDGAARRIVLAQGGALPSVGERFTINGQQAVATREPNGTRRLAVALPYSGVSLIATAGGDIAADQLVAIVRSVRVLGDRYLHPRSGTGDIRSSFSRAWLREQLEAAGANDVSFADGGVPAFLSARFTAADGASALGTFGPQTPQPLPPLERVVSLGTADFQTNGRQTYGYCNDIFVNIRSSNSETTARAIVQQLGC